MYTFFERENAVSNEKHPEGNKIHCLGFFFPAFFIQLFCFQDVHTDLYLLLVRAADSSGKVL